jgi:hypothetical protein
MKDILPKSDTLKRAIKWLSEHLKDDANQNISQLLNEATLRFDLSPKESEFLIRMYSEK